MGRECPDLTIAAAHALHTEFIVKDKDFDLATLVKNIKKAHNT